MMDWEMKNSAREEKYRKNDSLEKSLADINSLLFGLEKDAVKEFKKNKYPIIFILGNPRSGSTLLLQWLASLGCFGYPTNIISRFFKAPYIGAKIQKVLAEFDFKGEIFDPSYEKKFYSDLGKTKGPLAPHEFWYFWRRFFQYNEIQKLDDSELKQVDTDLLLSELAALESEFDKPLVFKGMMFNWNVEFLNAIFDDVLFINLKRNYLYNMDDIFYARKNFFGNTDKWYSFKPPEYNILKNKNPEAQVAGQVVYTDRYIREQFYKIPKEKYLNIEYEELCTNPGKVYNLILEKFSSQGYKLPDSYIGVEDFVIDDSLKVIDKNKANIELGKIL
jgi:hypothetical protein